MDKYFEANKKLWDAKTRYHVDSKFYDLDSFKAGESSLNPEDMDALGNVEGKSLLHLQCHFGQDTLSWAREGATVTGIDLSSESIKAAEDLRDEMGLDGTFVCCNVFDTRDHIQEQFDIVYTSYGVTGWLPELKPWGKVIADSLKPGGTFYIMEFHPMIWMFDNDVKEMVFSYFNKEVIHDQTEGTYADQAAPIKLDEYGWNHSLEEIMAALLDNGLRIEKFREYDYARYEVFPGMRKIEENKYDFENRPGMLPIQYSIKATK